MNNPKCENCQCYNEYYVKGLDCFRKTKRGSCSKHNSEVKKGALCEFWKENKLIKEGRERVSLQTLNSMAKDIKEIAQILKEELSDNG